MKKDLMTIEFEYGVQKVIGIHSVEKYIRIYPNGDIYINGKKGTSKDIYKALNS